MIRERAANGRALVVDRTHSHAVLPYQLGTVPSFIFAQFVEDRLKLCEQMPLAPRLLLLLESEREGKVRVGRKGCRRWRSPMICSSVAEGAVQAHPSKRPGAAGN